MSHPLDDALAGFRVERWIARTADRGVAIAREGEDRRCVSVPGAPPAEDDPALAGDAAWDLPLSDVREVRGTSLVVEALPAGVPSTLAAPVPPGTAAPPFVLELLERAAAEHAAGRLVGPLHPALVFVGADGGLAGTSRRILRLALGPRGEGWTPLFAAAYWTPAELRGDAPSPADDVFRLAAMTWRWRHGMAPFGTDAGEAVAVLAGRPVAAPAGALDRLLVRAFAPAEASRPTLLELVAGVREAGNAWGIGGR